MTQHNQTKDLTTWFLKEISDGDLGGSGDPDGTGGGVLASLGEGLPSVEGERERLVPLLTSIGG
jgi:hypothetical protein